MRAQTRLLNIETPKLEQKHSKTKPVFGRIETECVPNIGNLRNGSWVKWIFNISPGFAGPNKGFREKGKILWSQQMVTEPLIFCDVCYSHTMIFILFSQFLCLFRLDLNHSKLWDIWKWAKAVGVLVCRNLEFAIFLCRMCMPPTCDIFSVFDLSSTIQ